MPSEFGPVLACFPIRFVICMQSILPILLWSLDLVLQCAYTYMIVAQILRPLGLFQFLASQLRLSRTYIVPWTWTQRDNMMRESSQLGGT